MFCFECDSTECIKMNEILNKFLLAGDAKNAFETTWFYL